jgi:GT2 family glycosyltransferase
MEVLVVDGMSDDATRQIAQRFAAEHPHVRMVDNVKRIAPSAMNLGIAAARGSIIVRMDAHVEYPRDYISSLVRLSVETGADNVGGVCVVRPAGDSALARAIAVGLSHPLGVGNSYFRIGTAALRWGEAGAFGCFRRDVFQRFGLFDEELARNQDDELNLRLRKLGARLLLSPGIVSYYYARDSLGKLWRMFYQYGYFKPLVARKLGRVMTVRQLIPPLFATALLLGGLLAPWSRAAAGVLAALVSCYLLAILLAAARAARQHGCACAAGLFLVIPTMHFAYGLGYLKGVLDFWVRRKRLSGRSPAVPLSR